MTEIFDTTVVHQDSLCRYCRKSRQGFTLLELIVVITLIGLIASVSVPRMFLAVEAISAAAEERALSGFMAQMKLYAYLRHTPQHLLFNGQSIYRDAGQNAVAKFSHLMFHNQKIRWNANGFPETNLLKYTLRGQEKRLVLE